MISRPCIGGTEVFTTPKLIVSQILRNCFTTVEYPNLRKRLVVWISFIQFADQNQHFVRTSFDQVANRLNNRARRVDYVYEKDEFECSAFVPLLCCGIRVSTPFRSMNPGIQVVEQYLPNNLAKPECRPMVPSRLVSTSERAIETVRIGFSRH